MNKVKETKIRIESGGMWEYESWDLILNGIVSSYGGGKPCKHCKILPDKIHKRYDGTTYREGQWLCPRLIVAENEGGHNSTGVCADCVLETLNDLEEK